ncbi:MAG: energy transducer TonB [Candidatus Melainabacteria bacterium]|nr:energy transducer TonB [Candidatus Melainabacteria bacterium]
MTSILFDQKSKSKRIEPFLIALYSIIPGIGQLYNGKTTKGILFLVATSISLLMLFGSIHPASTLEFALALLTILKFILGFIFKFDFQPSPAAEFLMNSIKFGGSFSILLVLTIISFVIYSMVDAYLDANKALQEYDYKIISTDSTMFRFSESTASSYILHSVFFALLFLISLFLVIPSKNKEQITEIEFILPQVESKKPPPEETKRRSTVQSIDQGKHIPNKPITPASPTRPLSPPQAVPRVVQQMLAPPKPIAPPEPKVIPRPVPKIVERPALTQSQPAPIQNSTTQTEEKLPQPAAPAPDTANSESSSPGTVSAVAVIPKVPSAPGTGGFGNIGNPPPNSRNLASTSLAAKKDIDFGPYMNELQRRIKRSWRPPRGNESKRVIVTFKINKSGELSDLTLKAASGFEPSDKAALIAVQGAAPFARLPEGAPNIVDIEFTFDYNVFGSSSSYRQY